MSDTRIAFLVTVIYGIVETLEKFGLKKKYAHLLAIPLGILGSFFFIPSISTREHFIYGTLAGFISVGTCDTLCNVVDNIKHVLPSTIKKTDN